MCRNIRLLHHFTPPTTLDEIDDAAVQFVRKVSGMSKPSKANEEAFNLAVGEVGEAIHQLMHSLVTTAPHRDREVEAEKGRVRSAARFPRMTEEHKH